MKKLLIAVLALSLGLMAIAALGTPVGATDINVNPGDSIQAATLMLPLTATPSTWLTAPISGT